MDLIDRQAAIDAIEQHKTAVLKGREWDEGIAYGYTAAHRHLVDIVKYLPSAEKRGKMVDWTPISERKPFGRYLGEHILATLDGGEVCELDYGVDKAAGGSLWERVIAWMPMPDPYEEQPR